MAPTANLESRKARAALTQDRVKELFHYNPRTGDLLWRVSVPSRLFGTAVGRIEKSGYRVFMYDGVKYLAHRVAWLWMTGSWPAVYIDHVNGEKADNRWPNLREADAAQNIANSKKWARKGLPKGVYLNKYGTYCAQVKKDRVVHYLGTFKTASEGHQAYCAAAKKLFGKFWRPE